MKLVDMELDDEQKTDFCAPMPCDRPDYPYGLRVSFDQGSLDKLKTNAADFKVGDMIDMRCFGVVTSVSMDDASESGEQRPRRDPDPEDRHGEREHRAGDGSGAERRQGRPPRQPAL
jgi:hypothetical protein